MNTYRNLNVALAALVLSAAGMSFATPRAAADSVRLGMTSEGVQQIIVIGKRMNAVQKVVYDVKTALKFN